MQTADFGRIVQHGYVVQDAHAAARLWAERTGAGPFYMHEHIHMGGSLDSYVLRGQPADDELKIALGYWGDTQIELIQPLRKEGLYARALVDAPNAINHYGSYITWDIDEVIKRRNLEDRVLQTGTSGGRLRFVYFDGLVPGGLHLELIQSPPEMMQGLLAMEAAARAWDGRNPVRPAAALAEDIAGIEA